MKCSKCNHEYDDNLDACPLCGEPAPAIRQATSGYSGDTSSNQPVEVSLPPAVPASASESSGVAPLVLGILSLLIPFVGVILAIIAIVMGTSQRRSFGPDTVQHGFAQAGWVLGIVGLVCQTLLIIYFFVVVGAVLSLIPDMVRYSNGDFYPSSYFWS